LDRRSVYSSEGCIDGKDSRQEGARSVLTLTSPADTSRVTVALLQGLNLPAARTSVERDESGVPLTEVEAMVAACVQAMERVLGVRGGTLRLVDRTALREWYA
jgi:hypothetical protein